MKLHVLIASTRPGRFGPQVGEWYTAHARAHGAFDVTVVDLAEINLPFLDEPNHPRLRKYTKPHTQAWSALIDEADAFAFVTPEYNYGMNAPLKNALDFLFHEWRYKPVGFVSYGGVSAGLRAVQMTKQVLTALSMFPIGAAVQIPMREYAVDGELRPDAHLDKAAYAQLDELAQVAPAMASLRSGSLT